MNYSQRLCRNCEYWLKDEFSEPEKFKGYCHLYPKTRKKFGYEYCFQGRSIEAPTPEQPKTVSLQEGAKRAQRIAQETEESLQADYAREAREYDRLYEPEPSGTVTVPESEMMICPSSGTKRICKGCYHEFKHKKRGPFDEKCHYDCGDDCVPYVEPVNPPADLPVPQKAITFTTISGAKFIGIYYPDGKKFVSFLTQDSSGVYANHNEYTSSVIATWNYIQWKNKMMDETRPKYTPCLRCGGLCPTEILKEGFCPNCYPDRLKLRDAIAEIEKLRAERDHSWKVQNNLARRNNELADKCNTKDREIERLKAMIVVTRYQRIRKPKEGK